MITADRSQTQPLPEFRELSLSLVEPLPPLQSPAVRYTRSSSRFGQEKSRSRQTQVHNATAVSQPTTQLVDKRASVGLGARGGIAVLGVGAG